MEERRQFEEADALFRQGRYAEALQLLSELDRRYPNQKNLLLPMALCLEGLGRFAEAKTIARQLVREFDAPKARKLLDRLEKSEENLAKIWDDVHVPVGRAQYVEQDPDFPVWAGLVIAVTTIALLIVTKGFLHATFIPDEPPTFVAAVLWLVDASTHPAAWLLTTLHLAFIFGQIHAALFVSLAVTGAMPSGGFLDCVVFVARLAAMLIALCLIPIFGPFIAAYYFVRQLGDAGFGGVVFTLVGMHLLVLLFAFATFAMTYGAMGLF